MKNNQNLQGENLNKVLEKITALISKNTFFILFNVNTSTKIIAIRINDKMTGLRIFESDTPIFNKEELFFLACELSKIGGGSTNLPPLTKGLN